MLHTIMLYLKNLQYKSQWCGSSVSKQRFLKEYTYNEF